MTATLFEHLNPWDLFIINAERYGSDHKTGYIFMSQCFKETYTCSGRQLVFDLRYFPKKPVPSTAKGNETYIKSGGGGLFTFYVM